MDKPEIKEKEGKVLSKATGQHRWYRGVLSKTEYLIKAFANSTEILKVEVPNDQTR